MWRPQLEAVSPVSAMLLQLLLLTIVPGTRLANTSLDAGEQGECHVSRVEVPCDATCCRPPLPAGASARAEVRGPELPGRHTVLHPAPALLRGECIADGDHRNRRWGVS